MLFLNITLFLIFQVAANLFFKWGSTAPHLFWWGFGFGNLIGMSSILFMIMMYRSMPAALVIAIGTGGTFLLNQVAIFWVYRERISTAACMGLALIFVGIVITAFMNTPPPTIEAETALNAAQPDIQDPS